MSGSERAGLTLDVYGRLWLTSNMEAGHDDENADVLPQGFVRAVLDNARYTDSLMDVLEARLMALEEVAAARWPHRLILASRLRRSLLASVRPFTGRSFAQRRREAVSAQWLSAEPATPRDEDL